MGNIHNRFSPEYVSRIAPQVFSDLSQLLFGPQAEVYRINSKNFYLHFLKGDNKNFSALEIYIKAESGAITERGFRILNIPAKLSQSFQRILDKHVKSLKDPGPHDPVTIENKLFVEISEAVNRYNILHRTSLTFSQLSPEYSKPEEGADEARGHKVTTRLSSNFLELSQGIISFNHTVELDSEKERLFIQTVRTEDSFRAEIKFIGSDRSEPYRYSATASQEQYECKALCNKLIEVFILNGAEAAKTLAKCSPKEAAKLLNIDSERLTETEIPSLLKALKVRNNRNILNKAPHEARQRELYDKWEPESRDVYTNPNGAIIEWLEGKNDFYKIHLSPNPDSTKLIISNPRRILKAIRDRVRPLKDVVEELGVLLTSKNESDYLKAFELIKKHRLLLRIQNSSYMSDTIKLLSEHLKSRKDPRLKFRGIGDFSESTPMNLESPETRAIFCAIASGREWFQVKKGHETNKYSTLGINVVEFSINDSNQGSITMRRLEEEIIYSLPKRAFGNVDDYLLSKLNLLSDSPNLLLENIINEISQHTYTHLPDGSEAYPIVKRTASGTYPFDPQENLALNIADLFYKCCEDRYTLYIPGFEKIKRSEKSILNFDGTILKRYVLQAKNPEAQYSLEFEICSSGILEISLIRHTFPSYKESFGISVKYLDEMQQIFSTCLAKLGVLEWPNDRRVDDIKAYLVKLPH